MTRRQADIESSVLSFQRDDVHPGVHVANIGLRKGEASTFHRHTETRDTFYVMSGALTVSVKIDPARATPHYRSLCATPPRIEKVSGVEANRETHHLYILPGEVLILEPQVVHCASNLNEEPCRFLCIEGIGRYDFIA